MTPNTTKRPIEYPEDDGEPMADNTFQYDWIVRIEGNLDILFHSDPNVFVAGNLLWYPIEGDNKTRVAPDALVVLGRPKGRRGSYRQWDEGGIGPQVIFEVLSPGNRPGEMTRKFQFYERFGVEEYYLYDPDNNLLDGWLRDGDRLLPISSMNNWISPRLGIRFELQPDDLIIYRPNGEPFYTMLELFQQRDEARSQIDEARVAVAEEKQRAEEDRLARIQAQKRADAAQQKADAAQQKADAAQQKAESLAAKLRALGVDPDSP